MKKTIIIAWALLAAGLCAAQEKPETKQVKISFDTVGADTARAIARRTCTTSTATATRIKTNVIRVNITLKTSATIAARATRRSSRSIGANCTGAAAASCVTLTGNTAGIALAVFVDFDGLATCGVFIRTTAAGTAGLTDILTATATAALDAQKIAAIDGDVSVVSRFSIRSRVTHAIGHTARAGENKVCLCTAKRYVTFVEKFARTSSATARVSSWARRAHRTAGAAAADGEDAERAACGGGEERAGF